MDITLAEHQNFTMNNYLENITTTVENNRNSLRRIARNDDTEFSHQSILNVMEKFVKTVTKMDETILVPCRMMDQKVGDENDPSSVQNPKSKSAHTVHQLLNSADLFHLYNMLNGVKDGLLWGPVEDSVKPEKAAAAANISGNSPVTLTVTKGHIRRPSSVSVASTNSSASTLSDTDSESGLIENDSGIEETAQEECKVEKIAQDFRRHLHGLTNSLRQMTEAAQYLTWRYQYDIAGPI